MKKKIAGLLVLAVLIVATSQAFNNEKIYVSPKALNTFSQRFNDAVNVSWNTNEDYLKASFTLDGQLMFAYFTVKGDLMAVCRNMVTTQLPIYLQTELKRNYSSGWVTDLFEYATDEETTFYATVETAELKTILKSSGNDSWTIYKKIKK